MYPIFIACNFKNTASKQYPQAAVIVKVEGGFLYF